MSSFYARHADLLEQAVASAAQSVRDHGEAEPVVPGGVGVGDTVRRG